MQLQLIPLAPDLLHSCTGQPTLETLSLHSDHFLKVKEKAPHCFKKPCSCKSILYNWKKLCYYQWNASTVKLSFPWATRKHVTSQAIVWPQVTDLWSQSRWRAKLTDSACDQLQQVSSWGEFPFWPYIQRCWTLTTTAQFPGKRDGQHMQIWGEKFPTHL